MTGSPRDTEGASSTVSTQHRHGRMWHHGTGRTPDHASACHVHRPLLATWVVLLITLLATAVTAVSAATTFPSIDAAPASLLPVATSPASVSPVATLPAHSPQPQAVDVYVSLAVDEFFADPTQRSEVRMLLHCLLYHESKHGATTARGDGGLASGPLQFHQATWDEYRHITRERGLVQDVGSREDLHEAIRTTVWAIKDGRSRTWGPIARAMAGSTDATCPVPSLY
jgi:hypothetical protein